MAQKNKIGLIAENNAKLKFQKLLDQVIKTGNEPVDPLEEEELSKRTTLWVGIDTEYVDNQKDPKQVLSLQVCVEYKKIPLATESQGELIEIIKSKAIFIDKQFENCFTKDLLNNFKKNYECVVFFEPLNEMVLTSPKSILLIYLGSFIRHHKLSKHNYSNYGFS